MTHHLLVHLLSRTIFLLALVVSVAGTALAAEPKRGGALRVAYGNEISNLDFHTAPGLAGGMKPAHHGFACPGGRTRGGSGQHARLYELSSTESNHKPSGPNL